LIAELLTHPLSLVYAKKICYVAADYEAELCKDTQASCEVDGDGWFTLAEERFKMAEILFQPQMGGVYDIFSVECLVCALNTAHLCEHDVYLVAVLWACIKQYLYVWIIAIMRRSSVITAGSRPSF
jgi:hypothetical protein